ncbi:MAG TPA: GspE/PulE family protein [Thermoanaerobaculia bacterium]|nr:GspE/PulE family protein [Thermoanaerobaculia bacterium]
MTFTELDHFEIDPRCVRLLDEDFCREREVVVLGPVEPGNEAPVTLGMVHPARRSVVREVAARLGRPVAAVRSVRLNAFEVRRALDLGWGQADPAADRKVLELSPVADFSFHGEAGAPELLDEILARAVQLGASDVHIERYAHDVDVRFRIDGLLRQSVTPLSLDNVDGVMARLKVLAELDIGERRRDQDGRLRATWKDGRGERSIDFRVSVVPGPAGEDAVLRILDRAAAVLGLEQLGFAGDHLATFERLVANPEGLVLVTGPTGSGKTTTLYAAIQRVGSPEKKILTAEDPIEYRFPKINQKQVSPQMGFAEYARAFLRQNPDILLIGEVRDEETADAAVRAAQTGHLVLSTLHTNDAVRTVARLRTLGVEPGMIASCLLGALSQRLVRRLCPHCREEAPPTAEEARRLGLAADAAFFRARGCAACGGRGTRGRTGIYELFVADAETADLIADGVPSQALRERAVAKGMRTLLDDALDKARAGVIPLSEILRTVPYRMLADARDRGADRGGPRAAGG